MARKLFHLSGRTLSRKRRKAGARKSNNEAPRDEETGIDPHERTEGIESGLQRDEETSGTAWSRAAERYQPQ